MIFLVCGHVGIVHIILVPFEDCSHMFFGGPVRPFGNGSGYIYCTGPASGIKQLCPPGTEVSYYIGGCVNKTSE